MKQEIALRSGLYFMIFDKNDIPFFDELRNTNQQVLKDTNTYDVYEAPNWDIAKKIDSLMGNSELGFKLDDYVVDKEIKM